MRRFPMILAAWLMSFACSSLPEPSWLQEARAREAAAAPAQWVKAPDGFFRARVPAKLSGPIESDEEGYSLRFEVAGGGPIECSVQRDELDLAGSLAGISDATFELLSQTLGPIEAKRIERVDAGSFAESPFLALDWMYRVNTDGSPRVGQVKHLLASKAGRSIYCQHNEVGYADTFRRVASALVQSIEYRKPTEPRSAYTQISTLTIRGMRVGVEHTTVVPDGKKDKRVDVRSALLVPVNGDTLQANDSFNVEFVRPDGSLINQALIESQNGELVTQLKLDPVRGGSWSVSGTFQTKPISSALRGTPASWISETLALRRTLAHSDGSGELTLQRWLPQADPTQLFDETLSIRGQLDADRFEARYEAAGLEGTLIVDRTGSVASGLIELGFSIIEIERVYMSGKI